jgi:hypothetical protein
VTGRYVAAVAAYVAAVTAIACTATWAASLLPITNPITAWGVCVAVGCFATLAATNWLPYPCQRKDGRG